MIFDEQYPIRTWTRGDNGWVLKDTHGNYKYYMPLIDYVTMSHLKMLEFCFNLPQIRFNKNYFLIDYRGVDGTDYPEAVMAPMVKVPKNIFDEAGKMRHYGERIRQDQKLPSGNGIILPDTHGNVKYYISSVDYMSLAEFYLYVHKVLPKIRFNRNYALGEDGSEIGMVKVPEEIAKVAYKLRQHGILRGWLVPNKEMSQFEKLDKLKYTCPWVFDIL
jgi:hypothetical protein